MFRDLVSFSSTLNLLLRPAARPSDFVPRDPVMRLTGEAPVADRWIERNRLPIKGEPPVRWREWCDDLSTTSATAFVARRCERDGNVNGPFFQLSGKALHEFVSKD